MATLREYILGRKKKLPRGAAQRVAQYLAVRHERAVRLIHGIEIPDALLALRIQDFISARRSILPKKTGPQNKSASRSSDTNQHFTNNRKSFTK